MVCGESLSDELEDLTFPRDGFRLLQMTGKVVKFLFWRRAKPILSELEALETAIECLKLSVRADLSDGYEQAREELLRALRSPDRVSSASADEERPQIQTEDFFLAEITNLRRLAVSERLPSIRRS